MKRQGRRNKGASGREGQPRYLTAWRPGSPRAPGLRAEGGGGLRRMRAGVLRSPGCSPDVAQGGVAEAPLRPRDPPTTLSPGTYCSGKPQARPGPTLGLHPAPVRVGGLGLARRLAAGGLPVHVSLRGWACKAAGRAGCALLRECVRERAAGGCRREGGSGRASQPASDAGRPCRRRDRTSGLLPSGPLPRIGLRRGGG